jgi:hypothetical protein
VSAHSLAKSTTHGTLSACKCEEESVEALAWEIEFRTEMVEEQKGKGRLAAGRGGLCQGGKGLLHSTVYTLMYSAVIKYIFR